ncbi:hypothetical protein SH2C18_47080 [Clostridium sediminicola]|uniref:hypothetical protein n=1 Tax=Clostridium sediminicola TaxID=3114879 RepID=UPI0031F1DC62
MDDNHRVLKIYTIGEVYYISEDYNKAAEYFFSAIRRLDSINKKFYAKKQM